MSKIECINYDLVWRGGSRVGSTWVSILGGSLWRDTCGANFGRHGLATMLLVLENPCDEEVWSLYSVCHVFPLKLYSYGRAFRPRFLIFFIMWKINHCKTKVGFYVIFHVFYPIHFFHLIMLFICMWDLGYIHHKVLTDESVKIYYFIYDWLLILIVLP